MTGGLDLPFDLPDSIQDGVYTLTTTEDIHLIADSDEQTDKIWFTTPVGSFTLHRHADSNASFAQILQDFVISRLEDIQLFTVAHNQGTLPAGGSGEWSWFDLCILETPESDTPVVKDGRSLVWRSHNVPLTADEDAEQSDGTLFSRHDPNHSEIFAHLKVRIAQNKHIVHIADHGLGEKRGNVIGVRPCVRFAGWELHARSARLVVRISNKGTPMAPYVCTIAISTTHRVEHCYQGEWYKLEGDS